MYRRKTIFVVLLAVMVVSLKWPAKVQQIQAHPATDAYEGWRLGLQAWTFNRFTFYDAVDKTASLGLDWFEAYPGQPLSKENKDVKFGLEMSPEIREQVKQKLRDSGVRLVNFGVIKLTNDEVQCRELFDFAKDMGIETIVSEPPEEAFDLLDRLCGEYKIKLAIHNHPKPSHYWNPDTVLAVCKDRSEWIGACADTGHWMRSGINPVEALRKLEGRIISLHFKDITSFGGGRKAHDVVWGTGVGDVKAMLAELHRQDFKGVFSIEYEYNWENSMPDIRQSVEYFNKVAGGLKPTGWRDLLAKDLSNCFYKPGSWAMADGVLTRKGGSYIWTRDKYGDFILDLEFKVAKGSNSGVFLRTGSIKDPFTGIEVQIHDTTDGSRHGACGAIYGCLSPSKKMAKKTGQWNHYTITCKANKIYVVMNGEQIIDMELDLWTDARKNPDGTGTPNWFKTAMKDMLRVGHIGFQDHGDPVWFRNIQVKPLDR